MFIRRLQYHLDTREFILSWVLFYVIFSGVRHFKNDVHVAAYLAPSEPIAVINKKARSI